MGQCVCSEQITILSEAPPLTFTSKIETIRDIVALPDEPLIQGDLEKNLSQTKTRQMEDSLILEIHRPDIKEARLTSQLFQTSSLKVKDLQDRLDPYEVEESETYFYGVYELNNGSLYQGGWLEGKKQGKGVQIMKNGSIYEGQFSRGMANGKGRIIYADGDYYIGEWSDDQHHGYGEYYHSDGAMYKGDWFENLQNGQGFELFSDQSRYTGQFKLGKREGFGVLNFLIVLFMKVCLKIINLMDKVHIFGEWLNDQMDGKGKMTWADGTIYEGEYKNDKKNGFGTLTWPDSRQYSGQWELGKQHGIGEYTNSQQGKRKGQWINGKRMQWCD
ncbi:unnamed protein product [Paramecium primaurelia]|uniref:MORN repeat protein n=1 Tax=Paramecium primaurelia TaxID=5886 RepID=A0A8S1MZM5_PARPR|nr:unnamed protein product [Paramecium primaurelia]